MTAAKPGSEPKVLRIDENSFRQNQVVLSADKRAVELVGCGKPHGDTKLKIVNPQTLAECPEREIGEIWVSGKSIAAGYLNNSKASLETFVEQFGERFLRTGDLGFTLDEELFVTGRIKELIIIRGKNHSPQEIEQTVSHSHPALQINCCAAFSAEIENDEKLVIVQEIRRSHLKSVDYEKIFGLIMNAISRNHEIFPHDIVLIPPNTLPKTSSGKIQRRMCRDLWHLQKLSYLAKL